MRFTAAVKCKGSRFSLSSIAVIAALRFVGDAEGAPRSTVPASSLSAESIDSAIAMRPSAVEVHLFLRHWYDVEDTGAKATVVVDAEVFRLRLVCPVLTSESPPLSYLQQVRNASERYTEAQNPPRWSSFVCPLPFASPSRLQTNPNQSG
jgi:hypothetical protein